MAKALNKVLKPPSIILQLVEKKLEGNICYGTAPSPFGNVWLAWSTGDEIRELAFGDDWQPNLNYHQQDDTHAAGLAALIFNHNITKKPLVLNVTGTDFQCEVWRALLKIPHGAVISYSELAKNMGKPKAIRAVASAVGANIIAWLIPCHRVIRSNGELGGYRWGLERKRAMLALEKA
jgi:O-6-methylguanine DNA methyltransferase